MTDDEFVRSLDPERRRLLDELDDRSREVAVGILRQQAAAIEQERREAHERWLFDRWPNYLRWQHYAIGEAERLLAEGATVENAERQLFDALPDDAPEMALVRRALALGPARTPAGLRALLNASSHGAALGRRAGASAAERFRAERDKFGQSMARQLMNWAGVADDDIEDSRYDEK